MKVNSLKNRGKVIPFLLWEHYTDCINPYEFSFWLWDRAGGTVYGHPDSSFWHSPHLVSAVNHSVSLPASLFKKHLEIRLLNFLLSVIFFNSMSLQILNISYEMSSGHVRRCLQINEQRVTLLQMFKKKLGIHSEGRWKLKLEGWVHIPPSPKILLFYLVYVCLNI